MNKLSTENNIKKHIALLPNRTKLYLTDTQKQIILEKTLRNDITQIEIDYQYVPIVLLRNAHLMSLVDYYQQHPEERPAPPQKTFSASPKPKYHKERALIGMMKGLKVFIDKNPDANNAKELCGKMEKRLKDKDPLVSVQEFYS